MRHLIHKARCRHVCLIQLRWDSIKFNQVQPSENPKAQSWRYNLLHLKMLPGSLDHTTMDHAGFDAQTIMVSNYTLILDLRMVGGWKSSNEKCSSKWFFFMVVYHDRIHKKINLNRHKWCLTNIVKWLSRYQMVNLNHWITINQNALQTITKLGWANYDLSRPPFRGKVPSILDIKKRHVRMWFVDPCLDYFIIVFSSQSLFENLKSQSGLWTLLIQIIVLKAFPEDTQYTQANELKSPERVDAFWIPLFPPVIWFFQGVFKNIL